VTDLLCVFLPRERREERFFLGFLLMKSIPQKKKREEKGDREKCVCDA